MLVEKGVSVLEGVFNGYKVFHCFVVFEVGHGLVREAVFEFRNISKVLFNDDVWDTVEVVTKRDGIFAARGFGEGEWGTCLTGVGEFKWIREGLRSHFKSG